MGSSLAPSERVGKRTYRRHTPEFKARVVAACREPGASVAEIALAHQLNANRVRRGLKDPPEGAPREGFGGQPRASVGRCGETRSATLVPVAIVSEEGPVAAPIEVEICRSGMVVQRRWPVASAGFCVQWLRDLLR